jgi:hypothetical protein
MANHKKRKVKKQRMHCGCKWWKINGGKIFDRQRFGVRRQEPRDE